VQRLTKEGADFRNEAEDADLSLACIADQLGIKGSIKDWLQSIGGAIRELKTEVERLSTPRVIGGQEMENILELKAEMERLTKAFGVKEDYVIKLHKDNDSVRSRVAELEKAVRENWVEQNKLYLRCRFCGQCVTVRDSAGTPQHKPDCVVLSSQDKETRVITSCDSDGIARDHLTQDKGEEG